MVGWPRVLHLQNAPPTLLLFVKRLGIESLSDFVHFVTKAGYKDELKTVVAASPELAEDRTGTPSCCMTRSFDHQ